MRVECRECGAVVDVSGGALQAPADTTGPIGRCKRKSEWGNSLDYMSCPALRRAVREQAGYDIHD